MPLTGNKSEAAEAEEDKGESHQDAQFERNDLWRE